MNTEAHPDAPSVKRRTTGMAEVARIAGVSRKTVSRVFNDEPYVSADARAKVLAAAAQIGFRPNAAAQALIRGRFDRIGVVAPDSALYGPASLMVALERAARKAGLSLMVSHTVEGDPATIGESIEWVCNQGVDGIVLFQHPIDDMERTVFPDDIPTVSFGAASTIDKESVTFINDGTIEISKKATEYLLDLGHEVVWHVSGPTRWLAASERLEGWKQAHTDRGITPPAVFEGDWTPASGYELGRRLAQKPEVTAIFCANDDMALGIMSALTQSGLSVPHDVSLIGYDDTPGAAYLIPPLTTVRQSFDLDATRAIELLQHHMRPTNILTELDTARGRALIRRSSTAPPRR